MSVVTATSFRQQFGSVYVAYNDGDNEIRVDIDSVLGLLQVVMTAIRLHGDKELARKVCASHLGGTL